MTHIKNATRNQAVTVYRKTISLLTKKGTLGDKSELDAHLRSIVESTLFVSACKNEYARWAWACISTLHAEYTKISLQITPETLNMGGGLGGDLIHDSCEAEAIVRQVANQADLDGVRFHRHSVSIKWS